MLFVVASIGSDGLLGIEALQSCLPHQLDLRTGQLWADGRSTLKLHQQRLTPEVEGLLMTSVVLPPDSEIVAPFSVSGLRKSYCALVEPSRTLTEKYGVVVGHTLVDASSLSASVLRVNPNAEEVVLPSFTCVGKLVPVSAISVALADPGLLNEGHVALPDHLDEIVMGYHPSLGESGRQLLRELLYRYRHVFPAPGELVTGRTTSVQHEILTSDARPVLCGPRRLAPASLRTEQTCIQVMLLGGQIEPSDSPWASPVVLVTKKDGSTRFCVDYRRLNVLTIKDTYPLLTRLEEVLGRLSNFGLQLKAKKYPVMQTEVVFLGHIVSRTGLVCDPAKLSAVRNWHVPDKVKGVRQFVGFVGYCRRFVKDFAALGGTIGGLNSERRPKTAFEALKACLISAPILGFPTENGRFVLDTDASLFAVRGGGGVLNQLQDDQEVVIAYASRSLRLPQRRYCTTCREMLAAVVMCTHF